MIRINYKLIYIGPNSTWVSTYCTWDRCALAVGLLDMLNQLIQNGVRVDSESIGVNVFLYINQQ
jgi:hypothetical protein